MNNNRSNRSFSFYVVYQGNNIGIYQTWIEAVAAKGPNGYAKGFHNRQEAESFLTRIIELQQPSSLALENRRLTSHVANLKHKLFC